jgi:hypothetical protein
MTIFEAALILYVIGILNYLSKFRGSKPLNL